MKRRVTTSHVIYSPPTPVVVAAPIAKAVVPITIKSPLEILGTSIAHNELLGNLYIVLKTKLKKSTFRIFFDKIRVKLTSGEFAFPDLIVCNPNPDKYFTAEPLLIVEIFSDTTRKTDLIDKYLLYQQIKTLQYYLCIEPEKQFILFFFRDTEGDWQAQTLINEQDIVNLNKINVSFSLKEIYKAE